MSSAYIQHLFGSKSFKVGAIASHDEIVTVAANGNLHFLSATGGLRGNVRASESPIALLAPVAFRNVGYGV